MTMATSRGDQVLKKNLVSLNERTRYLTFTHEGGHAMTIDEGLRIRRTLLKQLGRCPCLSSCVRCECLRSLALALLDWLDTKDTP
jgi:hypothetical protein